MGHSIQAIIGKQDAMKKLVEDWLLKEIPLPQDFCMIFLTSAFLEDVSELQEIEDDLCCPELDFFSTAMAWLLETYTFRQKLAYIETDYFGGVGTQGGVLYENQKISIPPQSGAGTINKLLRELGAWCEPNKDEFDSLHLGQYRRMDRSFS